MVLVTDMFVMWMCCNRWPVRSIIPTNPQLTYGILPVIRVFAPLTVEHCFPDVQLASVDQKHYYFEARMKSFDLVLHYFVVVNDV